MSEQLCGCFRREIEPCSCYSDRAVAEANAATQTPAGTTADGSPKEGNTPHV